MNGKVKSVKQCFYQNRAQCQKLQQVFEMHSFVLDTDPQPFCRVDSMLPEVSPEVRCNHYGSGVSSCCCNGNHAAGSKPI